MMKQSPVILFDGICNLCNAAVQYVIRHDPKGIFKFASIQSDTGKRLMNDHHIDAVNTDSFILIINNKAFIKSTAALTVARKLNALHPLLYGFIIVPALIRNGVYDFIARNRYKWFGQADHCMLPTPGLQSRFLK